MEEFQNEKGQSKPQKTWFFQRGDGKVFATGESEAWGILHDRSNWARRDFTMLGMSDGHTYFKIIKEAKKEAQALIEEKEQLSINKTKYLQTEDRMRFTELLDEDDPKLIKVMTLIADVDKRIEEINDKLSDFNKATIEKAFDAELEKAKGNMARPSNADIITPNSKDREKILNNLKV